MIFKTRMHKGHDLTRQLEYLQQQIGHNFFAPGSQDVVGDPRPFFITQ
jgi:hypothetical protein